MAGSAKAAWKEGKRSHHRNTKAGKTPPVPKTSVRENKQKKNDAGRFHKATKKLRKNRTNTIDTRNK